MTMTLKFVSAISASRTTRLDLNDGATFRGPLRAPDLSPPELKRATAGSMLRDGEDVTASAYANRVLELVLKVEAATETALATALQNLHRELDRAQNILEYSTGAANPVFFRTFRCPQYQLDIDRDPAPGRAYVGLHLLCEPFAYGLPVTATAVNVKTDPALTNGHYLDVTGVLGDVPTPALIRCEAAGGPVSVWMVATRARGAPASLTFVHQAESLTAGIDTSVQANSALFSGAGSNYMRTTFATSATIDNERLYGVVLAGAEGRGRYRVLARVRRTSAAGSNTIKLRARWAPHDGAPNTSTNISNDEVTVNNDTVFHIYDLGLISVPYGPDPVHDGYSGTERPVKGVLLELNASRSGGSSDLDWDYVLLIPADEHLAIADVQGICNDDYAWLDAITDRLYSTDAADGRITTSDPQPLLMGGLPELLPGVTNRLYVVTEVGGTNQLGNTIEHVLTNTLPVQVTHYPRYLYIRA